MEITGNYLKSLRQQQKMGTDHFAADMGIPKSTYCGIEAKGDKAISPESVHYSRIVQHISKLTGDTTMTTENFTSRLEHLSSEQQVEALALIEKLLKLSKEKKELLDRLEDLFTKRKQLHAS